MDDKTVPTTIDGAGKRQHWIYVLGGADVLQAAHRWEARKTAQGKLFGVIDGAAMGSPASRLAAVGSDDVVYVLSEAVEDGRLGVKGPNAEELAGRLRAEGLGREHREVKVFASRSGDGEGEDTFAGRLFRAMTEYPEMVVSGYRGEVDVEGFDGHKTAGLGTGETLAGMDKETWLAKGARARENRVQYSAKGVAAE